MEINSSYKAGLVGEDEVQKILSNNNFTFYRCSKIKHSGDFIIFLNNFKICIDVKNHYLSNENKNNLKKLKSDVESQRCDFGIIVFVNTKNILEIEKKSSHVLLSIDKLVNFLNKYEKN